MEHMFQTVERIAPAFGQSIGQDEQNRRLSESVTTPLRKEGLYKLFLPASLGGLEATPLTTAKLVERVARHNAAAAWSIMVANASNWWSRILPAKGIEEIYTHSADTFFAGTFALPMKAARVEGGFMISGQTPLCSNVREAQWVGVAAIVMQDDRPVLNNGMPEMRLVVMKAADVRIVDTWHSLGMKATDSNDVAAENVFVPEHRTGIVSPVTPNNKYHAGALYRFPVAGINGCSLVVPVALGIAAFAVEELKSLAEKIPAGSGGTLKEKGSFQRKLAMADALVRSARAYLHQSLSDCWKKVEAGEAISLEDKAALLLAGSHANKSCVEAVDLVYGASGTTGTYTHNKISRCFTDMQVVRQHGFANENRFETAAQLLLGLQPDFFPVVL
jgi:alkylation response protein AidB-like acyl-CoA dehydrogenase